MSLSSFKVLIGLDCSYSNSCVLEDLMWQDEEGVESYWLDEAVSLNKSSSKWKERLLVKVSNVGSVLILFASISQIDRHNGE
jgi:antibiotic biosynthesis monooxygenase (ABM) superfamily enzyme